MVNPIWLMMHNCLQFDNVIHNNTHTYVCVYILYSVGSDEIAAGAIKLYTLHNMHY